MSSISSPPNWHELARRQLAAFVQTGRVRPALPAGSRAEVVAALTAILLHLPSLKTYTAALDDERRGQKLEADLLALDPQDIPVETIAGEGFASLSDDDLASLAIDPTALRLLWEFLNESMAGATAGRFWWDALFRATPPLPEAPPAFRVPAPTQPVARRGLFWGGAVLALAASLLLAFLGGRIGAPTGGGQPTSDEFVARLSDEDAARVRRLLQERHGTEILVAQAAAQWGQPRAGVKEPQLTVEGPFDGFVTVVALAPARKQQVQPGFGVKPYPVSTGHASEPIWLPDGTTEVLFVVTETNAAETVRSELDPVNARRYTADKIDELRAQLETLLKGAGYRRLAFGRVAVPPPDK